MIEKKAEEWGRLLDRARVDDTLAPFGGRFIVRGGEVEVLEGSWSGHLIVLEFPDRTRADAWYSSDAYREIVALRTDNVAGYGHRGLSQADDEEWERR